MPTLNPSDLPTLAGKFTIIVDERSLKGTTLAPVVAAGNRQTLAAATYVLQFSLNTFLANTIRLEVTAGAHAGSRACYFLPYCENAATEITLGAAADYFFTSTLSGCTVKVHGPPATPTVIHANARSSYMGALDTTKKGLPKAMADSDKAAQAEVIASHVAQGAIDNMLGATVVGERLVKKADYLGKLTTGNLAAAKSTFGVDKGFKVHTLKPYMEEGDIPKVGAFVYGVRNTGSGAWAIFYQSSAAILGTQKKSRLLKADTIKQIVSEDAVLGLPEQIF